MPFTVLHMLPVISLKLKAPRTFSLAIYGLTQVLMDMEPLYKLLMHIENLHSITHNMLMASCLIAVMYLVYKGITHIRPFAVLTDAMFLISAGVGAYFHLFLDSLYHSDVILSGICITSSNLYACRSLNAICMFLIYQGLVCGLLWFIYQVSIPRLRGRLLLKVSTAWKELRLY